MSRTLQQFSLPLPSQAPFGDYPHSISQDSCTTAFNNGVDERDRFQDSKMPLCIICGRSGPLEHAYIVPKEEDETWEKLRRRGYFPKYAKSALHEPRNSITLCKNHHSDFNDLYCFIRFIPEIRKFVFIDFSRFGGRPNDKYHGKAALLDIDHRLCPFPNIFLVHEMRVRGCWPFLTDRDISQDPEFPNWRGPLASNVEDSTTRTSIIPAFVAMTAGTSGSGVEGRDPSGPAAEQTGNSGTIRLTLDDSTIQEIVTASRELPSWKACELEGTSWEGTADENVTKYREITDI
ncbi:hypothetical protein BDZ97DRAFT_1656381 [Flammula alnicola]|nr:hypothetical protein BDZ97DRAFT_1656381 [Flammula alnicola]